MLKSLTLNEAIQKTTKLLTQSNITVTSQGANAFVRRDTQGNVVGVNIPVIPSNPTKEFIAALHGFVDQEVAGILFTDMPSLLKAKKEALSEIKPHYVPRFEAILDMVERVRVEQMMIFKFEGSVGNVAKAIDFVLSAGGGETIKTALEEDDKETLIKATLPLWLRAAGGNAHVQLFIRDNGLDQFAMMLTASFPSISERMEGLTSSASSVELAKDIVLAWGEHDQPEQEGEEGGEDEGEDEGDGDGDDKGESPDGDAEDGEENEGEGKGEGDEADDKSGGKGKSRHSRKAMQDAIAQLPQDLRNILADQKYKKLSLDEIAEKRGLSRANVEESLIKARQMLAKNFRSNKAA